MPGHTGDADRERSDAELLAASADDPDAFGVFYDRHARALLAFFYRRTASVEMAADLAAETFAEAFASRRRFRKRGESAAPWLLGIGRHQLSRALRKGRVQDRARRRLGVPRLAIDELSYERIETLVDFAPMREAIRAAMARMPPNIAQALVLRVGLDLPYSEVSDRLGCSEGAARVRVARGLDRLAQMLEEA